MREVYIEFVVSSLRPLYDAEDYHAVNEAIQTLFEKGSINLAEVNEIMGHFYPELVVAIH